MAQIKPTPAFGNCSAPNPVIFSGDVPVSFFGIRWDGDKIRGICMKPSNDNPQDSWIAGDYSDDDYTLTEINLRPGEALRGCTLYDSGYGYRSIRQISLTTTMNQAITAGPGGYDNTLVLDNMVNNMNLRGFVAWVNPDNFINGLSLLVSPASSIPTIQTSPYGNVSTNIQFYQLSSPATFFSVRWDGDKVRGIAVQSADGQMFKAGGYDDDQYKLNSINFATGELLKKVTLYTSGYGYTSIRRIDCTTSLGQNFSAGSDEGWASITFDQEVANQALWGFVAWVNPDNFINGLSLLIKPSVS